MKNSTAIGTTATAESYRGRFAPSPTGFLHQGSLLAALGSWLDARAHAGKWLIRMEDLDRPRTVAGAADAIVRTLGSMGLVSDEPLLWQSSREQSHASALAQLQQADRVYRCTCSRTEHGSACSGRCRLEPVTEGTAAWRLKLGRGSRIEFDDLFMGPQQFDLNALGEPVLFRRDGIAAYQLAVVVDDAFQRITHVVRGADLLESAAWQIAVYDALALPRPRFGHLPLVIEPDGSKLSKSRGAQAVAHWAPGVALELTLRMLGYDPPEGLAHEPVAAILDWAVAGWSPAGLRGRTRVAAAT